MGGQGRARGKLHALLASKFLINWRHRICSKITPTRETRQGPSESIVQTYRCRSGHDHEAKQAAGRHRGAGKGLGKGVAKSLLELTLRLGLFRAHSAYGDFRPEVILTPHRAAGQAAQHGNLADVREGISDRALKQPFHGTGEWRFGSKTLVKSFQRGKEASRSLLPGERRGIVPSLFALGKGKRPVEQVADVGQDLGGRASGLAGAKFGKSAGAPRNAFPPR